MFVNYGELCLIHIIARACVRVRARPRVCDGGGGGEGGDGDFSPNLGLSKNSLVHHVTESYVINDYILDM